MQRVLVLIVMLSIIGGLFKILGGIIYGSKSLFVDAMTSIANTFAIIVTVYFFRISFIPPDKDHPYGHYRLALGGPITTIAAYSFVFGIALMDLIETAGRSYTVSIYAPIMAVLGFVVYAIAIALAKKMGGVFTTYARFTVSELIESSTTIATSLAGALLSYLVDFAGAIALLAYLFKELVGNTREVIAHISDFA
ncbi:MAG TPA: cation transporter, partial [Ignisphaera sp.]|nr:cation transporter [Ignisphaera sp.]